MDVFHSEFVAYGRTLLLPDNRSLSVTPRELVERLIDRALIIQEADKRKLTHSASVQENLQKALTDPVLSQSVQRREGAAQFAKNLRLFDLYKQLRAQITTAVRLTAAEIQKAHGQAFGVNDRPVVEKAALEQKRDQAFAAWLRQLRGRSRIVIKDPLPEWRV